MRVLQVFRAPVGGLFRHVRDLVRGLSDLGHDIGIVCDSNTGGEAAQRALEASRPFCRLGVHRLPMARLPGLGDILTARGIARHCRSIEPQVMHGHGAKGGAYARIAARGLNAKAIYTPHGGSLHYSWRSAPGALYLATERLLLRRTSGLVFVCEFERRAFAEKIGLGSVPNTVVYNGLWPEEFEPVFPRTDASDILFIGELRMLKGVDVLLDALAALKATGLELTAHIVGAGADRAAFEEQVKRLGLDHAVRFLGPMPAHKAFPLGRILVMPSRAESFPYVALEAAAAGMPIVASRVGGIVEMLPPGDLVDPGDAARLADAIARAVTGYGTRVLDAAFEGRRLESRFSARGMAEGVQAFYASLLNRGPQARGAPNRARPVGVS